MKSIDVKSLLIGFLLCSCFFLFTAQSQLQKMFEVTDRSLANRNLLNEQLYTPTDDKMHELQKRAGIMPGRFSFVQDKDGNGEFHVLDTQTGAMF